MSRVRRLPGIAIAASVALAAHAVAGDVGDLFEGLDVTLVVHHVDGKTILRHDADRAAERFGPCSTFKIPNTLVALDTGVADGPDFLLHFDPKRDLRQPYHSDRRWETVARDHTLRSAFENSVVWYYQEIARRIGASRMTAALETFDYGNRDISSGIDRFWLGESLLISADEQVRFVGRVLGGEFGSDRSRAWLDDIMTVESGDSYRLAGKTGLCRTPGGRPAGWYVGYVVRPEQGPVVFALHMEGDTWDDVMPRRVPLARAALIELGVLPAPEPAP